MILAILSFLAGLITGVLVMRKHGAKASELEAKGKAALDALKGR
jgi:type II secretory pathway pseudopilin PulG